MQCPKCGIETRIVAAYTAVEGDRSPDTPTRVFTVQEHTCVNSRCAEYDKIVATRRHLQYEQ